jgi:hypothetical protein
MSEPSNHQQQQGSISSRFIRGAGEVQDRNLWGPARWVVQLVQYLIAIILVTIAEGFKAIVSGKKPSGRHRRRGEGREHHGVEERKGD